MPIGSRRISYRALAALTCRARRGDVGKGQAQRHIRYQDLRGDLVELVPVARMVDKYSEEPDIWPDGVSAPTYPRGAGAVDSRTISSGSIVISPGYCFSRFVIRSSSTSAPRLPISCRGCRTVVSDGVE